MLPEASGAQPYASANPPSSTRSPGTAAVIVPAQPLIELGGQCYGQVKLALMNEILGRARGASIIFGCQAPDSGNSEILAHFGTPEQKQEYLEPLLRNEIVSCFSMTEPQGGADPKVFRT